VLAGTHLSGNVFGFGDRAFIFAVRLTHQMVMTRTGKVVFSLDPPTDLVLCGCRNEESAL